MLGALVYVNMPGIEIVEKVEVSIENTQTYQGIYDLWFELDMRSSQHWQYKCKKVTIVMIARNLYTY